MHSLEQLMRQKIASGLRRKTITSCSKWACEYRVMSKPFPGPWNWSHHPWLKEMHDSTAEMNVGQKAAQMGFTEWALNTTFYKIDVEGVDCLYVLPSDGDASDFSAGRFDPALEGSPHLKNLFSDVRNVGHKRAGQQNLYVRGSKSRSKLKSIPTGFIVFDEVEEMNQDNIPLAMERASGQVSSQVLMLSTPRIEKKGINKYYLDTTQEHFLFKCPSCSHLIEFIFPDSLVITADSIHDTSIINSHYICHSCKAVLPHANKPLFLATGRFVPTYADRSARGFTVSQLYSSAKAGNPVEIAKAYLASLTDRTAEQELYNSKLGLTHIVDGACISDTELVTCLGSHKNGLLPTERGLKPVTMGVDVGKLLHVWIDEWTLPSRHTPGIEINDESTPKTLYAGTVREFTELDALMMQYGVRGCVVDRHPETRLAYQFATRFWGRILLCMYGRGMMGKQVSMGTDDERTLTVDRTSWMDLSLGRFHNGTISLPYDLTEDVKNQLKEPVRIYIRDKDGNPVGRYENKGADHYAHARTYSEIALPLALAGGTSYNIRGI